MHVTKFTNAFHALFGPLARQAIAQHAVIQRQRKFDPVSLPATFVLGLLNNPHATLKDFVETAARLGVNVTQQAILNRLTEAFAHSLQQLFHQALTQVVGDPQRRLAPLLSRFSAVTIRDSTTISLPPSQRDRYPGCGGREETHGAAALKCQTEFDLCSGAIAHLQIESGKTPDAATSRQFAPCAANELQIADLGYFNLDVFRRIIEQMAYFLSRVQIDTKLYTRCGEQIDLAWLKRHAQGLIDIPITMGVHHRLACRLIAWRVPEEHANRRKQKRREVSVRKRKREPNSEALEWCEWSLFVTNVPAEQMSGEEGVVLYRARWQVELLFKRWKSIGQIDLLDGSSDVERMIRFWSRMIGALIQHWLTTSAVWFHGPSHSLYQVARYVAKIVPDLIRVIRKNCPLDEVLDLFLRMTKHCRHNKRKKPSAFELLNDASLLDFRLT